MIVKNVTDPIYDWGWCRQIKLEFLHGGMALKVCIDPILADEDYLRRLVSDMRYALADTASVNQNRA